MKNFNRELLNKFTYLMDVKKYSANTIDIYRHVLKSYFNVTEKQSKDISLADFESYILILSDNNKLSFSAHSQLVSAWRLYLKLIHNKKLKYDYKYQPRKSKKCIEILSWTEVKLLLDSIEHVKQKAIVSGIYYHGLRVSEILNLRYENIDKSRGLLIIKEGKGKKDRLTPLNDEWLEYLKLYSIKNEHKKGYDKLIFCKYSVSSIAKVIKTHAKKVGINKRVYPHVLRDSYASHLLEAGYDSRIIQEILGHSDIRTTEKYLHISAINISKVHLKLVS